MKKIPAPMRMVVFIFLFFAFAKCNTINNNEIVLNRHPAAIYYSKHAQCRMSCRHINKNEVQEILEHGKINFTKSQLAAPDSCRRKYALEGYSNEGQHLRIVFVPCENIITVVTVIDLDKEWKCNCK